MKKRRVQADELSKMGRVAVIWCQPSISTWCVVMLSLIQHAGGYLYFDFLHHRDIICTGKSKEEVLLKVQIAQPHLKLFAVTFHSEEFSPPCNHDISDKDYVVHEVTA